MAAPENLQRLGELLLEEGLVTHEELVKALDDSGKKGTVIGDLLITSGHVKKEDLVRFLGREFQVPQARLGDLRITPDALKLVPFEVAQKHEMVPLERIGNLLCVAKANYYNRAAVQEVRRLTNLKVKVVQADASEVQQALQYYYKGVGQPPAPSQVVAGQARSPAAARQTPDVRQRTATAGAPLASQETRRSAAPAPEGPMAAIWVPREDAMSIARIWKEDVAGEWERTFASDKPIPAVKGTR